MLTGAAEKLNPAPDPGGDGHLLYEQLLAHGDALVEPLLVLLQELLLLVDLSPQVAVGLAGGKKGRARSTSAREDKRRDSAPSSLTLSRSSMRPSFFSRSRLLLLSRAASFRPVSSVCERWTQTDRVRTWLGVGVGEGGCLCFSRASGLPGHTCWRRPWGCVPRNTGWWATSCSVESKQKKKKKTQINKNAEPHIHSPECKAWKSGFSQTHNGARSGVRVLRRPASGWEASDRTGAISSLELCRRGRRGGDKKKVQAKNLDQHEEKPGTLTSK